MEAQIPGQLSLLDGLEGYDLSKLFITQKELIEMPQKQLEALRDRLINLDVRELEGGKSWVASL